LCRNTTSRGRRLHPHSLIHKKLPESFVSAWDL
jgi:hypothetical protein